MLYVWFSIYNSVQETISNEEIALISYVAFFVLTIATVFVMFFVMFQRRKNQLLKDKIKQQQKFDEELIVTQQEIQEETLKHLGRELHDNVGQRLVLATMQMNALVGAVNDEAKAKAQNTALALKDSLEEVRAISKSLNSDVIYNLGFDATVKNEIARLNKSGLITCDLSITGKKIHFENKKDEIILFRILQEFFSNTLKYANAERLIVKIDYQIKQLDIRVEDDGNGFDIKLAKLGSGLINMKKRADLLKATFALSSEPEKGTVLRLQYPFNSTDTKKNNHFL